MARTAMGNATPTPEPASSVLLAAPEDDPLVPRLIHRFAEAGWDPVLVHRADEIPWTLGLGRVAGIALDMALPRAQEALHALKLDPATDWIPVIAVFPRGSDPQHPPELRVRADVEAVQPVSAGQLVEAMGRKAIRSGPPPAAREVRFILPSQRAALDRACEVASILLHSSGLGEADQTSFAAGFREAVGNAMQHGNGGDPAKSVRIVYRRDPVAVTFGVSDEGPGFDAQRYLQQVNAKEAAEAARDRYREGRHGGLGILMLLRCSDVVRYNQKGNTLTCTKLIHKPRQA